MLKVNIFCFRNFSGSNALMADGVKDESWFKKMLSARQPIDTPSATQSKLLSELDSVYELQCKQTLRHFYTNLCLLTI